MLNRWWIGCVGLLLWTVSVIAEETITLNMKEADISALIGTVAEVTGKNFIIDPRVKGKVTVVSPHPMSKDELYQVFLSILSVHKFSAVPSGTVIKIIPEVEAKQDSIPNATTQNPGEGDESVTRVVQLKNVSAAQLVPILRPLIPAQGGHLAAYPASNVLIISDRARNIERVVELIARIDQESDSDIEIITLNHAAASEVSRVISSLSKAGAGGGAGMPQMDGGGGGVVNVVADERTNSLLLSGDKGSRLRMRAIIAHLDTPMQSGGNTKVVYLRYAQAEEIMPVLTGVGNSAQVDAKAGAGVAGGAPVARPSSSSNEDFDIQADKSTNSLVITADPDVMRSLESVIRQLDIRRAQVLVEGVIAEVSAQKSTEIGVQLRGASGGNSLILGGTNFTNGGASNNINEAAQNVAGVGPGLSLGFIDGSIKIPGTDAEITNLAALAQALSSDTDTNLLSTPTLVTMDNQEAEIVVGQNVPFITGSYASSGGTDATNPFQTIERQDVGLTLKVKPQINEGNAVQMDIEQEVSSVSDSTAGADIITNKRSIKTSVIVDDGKMIVLGGLMDDNLNETEQRVPLLGKIPVLGYLFKYKTTDLVKRNLLVFLRPRIIRDGQMGEDLMSQKYNGLRSHQIKQQEYLGNSLRPDIPRPLLPDYSTYNKEKMLYAPAPEK